MTRFALVVLLTGILTNAAAACDDTISVPRPCAPVPLVSIPAPPPEGAQSALPAETSSDLDRRDRIFYPGDTERLKPLGRKLLLNIMLDQKEIFTSPFHMNRHNAPIWLLSAGAIGGLIAADHRIANSFENSSGQVRWGGRISNIGASYTLGRNRECRSDCRPEAFRIRRGGRGCHGLVHRALRL